MTPDWLQAAADGIADDQRLLFRGAACLSALNFGGADLVIAEAGLDGRARDIYLAGIQALVAIAMNAAGGDNELSERYFTQQLEFLSRRGK
jgi:hypothetical protein